LAAQFSLHLPSQPLTYSFMREYRNIWTNPTNVTPSNTFAVCIPDECPQLRDELKRKFGWSNLREVGRVQPTVWGTPRELVVILREK